MSAFHYDIKKNKEDRARYFWPQEGVAEWWRMGWDWDRLEHALDGVVGFIRSDLLDGSPFAREVFACNGTEADKALEGALETAPGGNWLTAFGSGEDGGALRWDPFHLPLFDATTGALSPKHPDYDGPGKWCDETHRLFRDAVAARMEAGAAAGERTPLHGVVLPPALDLSVNAEQATKALPLSADLSFALIGPGLKCGHRNIILPPRNGAAIAPIQTYQAHIGDRAVFWRATFGDGADFGRATFGDRAVFWVATFGDRADFGGATFGDRAVFRNATFGDRAGFGGATFGDGAVFWVATFGDRADFGGATFGDGAGFVGTRFLGRLDMSLLSITGRRRPGWQIWRRRWWCIDFRNCDFGPNPNFLGVTYDRRHLHGHFAGVGGAANIYGDAHFRRDVLDQDHIDTSRRLVHEHLTRHRIFERNVIPADKTFGARLRAMLVNTGRGAVNYCAIIGAGIADGFDTPRHQPLVLILAGIIGWLIGGFLAGDIIEVTGRAATGADRVVSACLLLLGMAAALIRVAVDQRAALRARKAPDVPPRAMFLATMTLAAVMAAVWAVPYALPAIGWEEARAGWAAIGAVAAVGVVGMLNSSMGRFISFAAWGWFDYGREWDRVLVFGAAMIGLFGWAYSHAAGGGDGAFLEYAADIKASENGFTPWFAAAMGFATLGLTDVMTPLRPLGQALMILNVLSGFFTLGLVLAVLSNTFARRS